MDLSDSPLSDELGLAYAATIVGDTFTCSKKDMKSFRKQLADLQIKNRPSL